MSDRLPSHVLVAALIRQVQAAGGNAMLLARGDASAGAILVVTCNKSLSYKILERGIGPGGGLELIESMAGPIDDVRKVSDYWQRRRARDPDLWVVELDIPEAERFAAETIAMG